LPLYFNPYQDLAIVYPYSPYQLNTHSARMEHLAAPGVKVFVATGFPQKEDARRVMSALIARGVGVTYDWTRPRTGLDRLNMAMADAAGVKAADALIAIMTLPDYDYKGTWTEIGMAIGHGHPILLVSPFADNDPAAKCAKNVYFAHPNMLRVAKSVDEFLERLKDTL
jgi:nucleoside 2-deoxyribosyltransferase